jgi:hypothetical protein
MRQFLILSNKVMSEEVAGSQGAESGSLADDSSIGAAGRAARGMGETWNNADIGGSRSAHQ